jgi:hypothetical protein
MSDKLSWRQTLLAAMLAASGAWGPVQAATGAPGNSAMDAPLFYQLLIGEIELNAGEAGAAF